MVNKTKNICLAALFLFLPQFLSAQEELAQTATNNKFPLGADLYLSNAIGAGTVSQAYKQDASVSSNLYIFPSLSLGTFEGDREWKLQVELNGNLEWIGADNPILGSLGKKMSLGDIKVRSELKKALYSKDLGLSLTPALKMEVPVSKTSRDSNRMIGLGGYLVATWSKWGLFATYKPIFLGYAYSEPYKSGSCDDDASALDKLSGGDCKIAGRQAMFVLKNGFYTGYMNGNHTVTLGFRTIHSFLRKANQGEKKEKVKTSDVTEATVGLLEYAYLLPVSVPTTLSVGVSGTQLPYDQDSGFRAPFFNFTEPEKNQTEAYLAINVSI